ncbi:MULTISPECIES: prolyl oligopeptidase family protein [unclassified Pseudomonas]|uniref:prolyl oligopeptidase family serine peptidase n=1 Tax=unclassified Pseudomonas TaxID=196821 RepID=UPI0035BF9C2C
MSTPAYPHTRRLELTEELFGQPVADPYRWLEGDTRHHAEVASWSAAQNACAQAYLEGLPGREVFVERLSALFDHDRATAPYKRGGQYFHTRSAGLEAQATLLVRGSVHGGDRVLLDPNQWSADGSTAMADWSVSPQGAHVAYAVQERGSDWRTLRVVEVDTGRVLDDELHWARYTSLGWSGDGRGFFYSRYPQPADEAAFETRLSGHAIYYHVLGTAQAQDRLVHATPDQPHMLHLFDVTADGRYLAIYSTPGTNSMTLSVVDLATPDWPLRQLDASHDNEWGVVGNVGTRLVLVTTRGAQRRKIVSVELADAQVAFVDLVGEQQGVLNEVALAGGRLLVAYLVDACTHIQRFTLDGVAEGEVALPGIGSAGGFRGDPQGTEFFYVFTSYDAPTTIYRYDVAERASQAWAQPQVAADLDQVVVEQHFYTSRDGTRVPMFLMRPKHLRGPAPTLLYGYGGFGISLIPAWSPAQYAWVEQGGVLAVANIRGGGEYGKDWHAAGSLARKQNVFDDFIAAGQYLKAQRITTADGLAIQGESNGGLLVGAVVNQQPGLFDAALVGVGVLDMLRYNTFTVGQLWVGEYGDPGTEADFHTLRAYSPYHNIAPGQPYPAILVTTADGDDRVVPAHTFKYVAALQAADIGDKPHLARVYGNTGHGAGKPIASVIDELAEQWAFAAYWTGLHVAVR